jgi:hypothetical protein
MAHSVDDLCREKQIPIEELVARCGLEAHRVQAIYLGRWTPSPAERKAIADVFGVEPSAISWGHKTPIQHIYGHGPG